jgi:hypothetical protein
METKVKFILEKEGNSEKFFQFNSCSILSFSIHAKKNKFRTIETG